MRGYNYPVFSFDMDPVGVEEWLKEGPGPGEPGPNFVLETLDGEEVRLNEFLGRPVVLEFGSYTCPIFCGHIPPMEALAQSHPEATFLVIYTREAHPGEITPEHRSMNEKRAAARRLVDDEPIGRRVLIDDVEGTVHRRYGPAWDSAYVLDQAGKVVLRQAWVNPDDVAAVLDQLAEGTVVTPRQTTEMAPPTGAPMGAGLLRGGKRALWDFYSTAPPPVKDRLRQSPSDDVRSAIAEYENK